MTRECAKCGHRNCNHSYLETTGKTVDDREYSPEGYLILNDFPAGKIRESRIDALDNAAAKMLQAIEEAHPEGGMPEWMREPYWNLRETWGKK